MVIIYDFDGTLTPYSLPQYEIFKKCGYSAEDVQVKVAEEMKKGADNIYTAYFKCFRDILKENNIKFSKENICLGANKLVYNKGLFDFLEKYQSSKSGVKNYIVTSGIIDYIDSTEVRKYFDGVYGVILDYDEKKDDYLLTDKGKVDAIKTIQNKNLDNDIIYFGDGFTDKYAFEYVHSIGGKTVFIGSGKNSLHYYNEMNKNKIIDFYFEADFSINGKIDKFISGVIEK